MTWIKTIPYPAASGILKKYYDRVKGPDDQIDNILKAHSLRPHSLNGHMTLYKNVLHHRSNTLPKWYLEALGVYVSMLNRCGYCVEHHFHGLKRLLADENRAEAMFSVLKSEKFNEFFDEKFAAGMSYAKMLSECPADISEGDIENLRSAGFSDGEILEMNQVISYFHYANRTVLGLGVNTAGEVLGLSPNDNDDEENWGHS